MRRALATMRSQRCTGLRPSPPPGALGPLSRGCGLAKSCSGCPAAGLLSLVLAWHAVRRTADQRWCGCGCLQAGPGWAGQAPVAACSLAWPCGQQLQVSSIVAHQDQQPLRLSPGHRELAC